VPRTVGRGRPSDGAVIASCAGWVEEVEGVVHIRGVIQVLNATVTTLVDGTQCWPFHVTVRPSDGAVIAACLGDLELAIGSGRVIQVLGSMVTTLAECPDPVSVAIRHSDGAVIAVCSSGDYVRQVLNGTPSILYGGHGLCSSAAVRPSDGAVIAAVVIHRAPDPASAAGTGYALVHVMQLACPIGFYCPVNSSMPLPCSSGSWCPEGDVGGHIPAWTAVNPTTFLKSTIELTPVVHRLCAPSLTSSNAYVHWARNGTAGSIHTAYVFIRGIAMARPTTTRRPECPPCTKRRRKRSL
jgi:hypothetical protein